MGIPMLMRMDGLMGTYGWVRLIPIEFIKICQSVSQAKAASYLLFETL